MSDENRMQELLNFFKAMADADRLKIAGILAQQPHTVELLAEMLDLDPSAVSHHLRKLTQAGLVTARSKGHYRFYRFETKVLEDMARRLLEREAFPAIPTDVNIDSYDRKVLDNFIDSEGRLKAFPAQQKKYQAILRYVVKSFERGQRYSEDHVNEALSQFSQDYASLRRDLVAFGYMDREGGGGFYWRTGESEA